MSFITKQLIINNINLPVNIINYIKNYTFHEINKILKNDKRYKLLLTIPSIIHDATNYSSCVILQINNDKDYILDFEFNYEDNSLILSLQKFKYYNNGAELWTREYYYDGNNNYKEFYKFIYLN